jgi:hypothetical protein
MLKRTSVNLGKGQVKDLEDIARREGVAVAELIRWAVERFRADHRGKSRLPMVPPKSKRVRRGRPPKGQKGGKR